MLFERKRAKEEYHQQLVDRYVWGEMGNLRKSHHLSTSATLTLLHPSSTPPQTVTLLKTSASVPEILTEQTLAAINAPVPSPYLGSEPSTELPTSQHFVPPHPAMKQKFPKPRFKSSDIHGTKVWTDEQKVRERRTIMMRHNVLHVEYSRSSSCLCASTLE